MSELAPISSKKARLGRGLGSLLGAASELSTSNDQQNSTQTPTLPAPQQPSVDSGLTQAQAKTLKDVATIDETTQIWQIPIDRLLPNTQQPRQHFAPEALKDLTASIKENGILQPITARRKGERSFEIIAGERRWRAAQAAGLHEVPVILKEVSEQASLELAIIENIQRADLNPMEEAEAYDRLMTDYDLTQQQVSEKVGKERATVANSLRFLALPAEAKALLRKGQISAGHAKIILSVPGTEQQIQLTKMIVSDKLSVRSAEQSALKLRSGTVTTTPLQKNSLNLDVSRRLVDGLSAELQKLLGTKVQIDYSHSKGKVSISFYSDEQLTQLVEKLRASCQK
jgi:ParB family chromosome partitioning protein